MRVSEFDAFGPWIDPVREVEELPRLYRGAGIDPAACRLVLKVPRDIERRNASPSMDLYDHLLVVDQDRLTVLSRWGGRYTTVSVPLDRIVAIEDSTALLDGRLIVHQAHGKPISIAYNGSASAPVQDLVRLLRQLYLADHDPSGGSTPALLGGSTASADSQEPNLPVADLGLITAYQEVVRQEPGMRLITWAPRGIVTPIPGRLGPLGRLKELLWPVTLHAAIVVADRREVQVLHRRHWFTSGGEPAFSLARTILPLPRISKIQIDPHERYQRVRVVSVHSGDACLRFPAPAGIEAVLTGWAGRLAGGRPGGLTGLPSGGLARGPIG